MTLNRSTLNLAEIHKLIERHPFEKNIKCFESQYTKYDYNEIYNEHILFTWMKQDILFTIEDGELTRQNDETWNYIQELITNKKAQ